MNSNLVSLRTVNKIAKERTPEVIRIEYSKNHNKKYVAVLKDSTKIHFGDIRYEDYLIHHDKERRRRYRVRHSGDNITKPSAGRYSWFILW